MVCASPPKLRGRKISELDPLELPKVKKPVRVRPDLEPIDLPIHHGNGNFSFVLNFTTDVTEDKDESEETEQSVNVVHSTHQPTVEDVQKSRVTTTTTTTKQFKKDSMPDVNNEIFKKEDKNKLKKRKHKKDFFNDQQKKRHKSLKSKHDTKTRSRGRHRIVETDGSNQYTRDSRGRLFSQLLSLENDHIVKNTDGSGSAESFETFNAYGAEHSRDSLHTNLKPGLFYDAYVRNSGSENQNSGENG